MTLNDAAGRLLLVGCGAMAGAMLVQWLETGLDPAQVTAISPSGRPMPSGVRVLPAIPTELFDTVLLGFKPQQLATVRPQLQGLAPRVLVSILAGVELATLRALSQAGAVVRAMPNLPVAIGKGVVAVYGDTDASMAALMRPLGLVEPIADERLFDVATALAGSGPGFLARYIDATAAAGVALGLPEDQAARLALATVEGSAILAATSGTSPTALADRVASPGGSTRRGLDVLDADEALHRLITATLAAATQRNTEMAEAARATQ
jgi:pyrroline-5-carboxylate reductase